MTNFDYAVSHTLGKEGVFSDHPNDPGGKTKYGVTEDMWLLYWEYVGGYGPAPRIEDIASWDAREFYRHIFWDALGLDKIDKHIAAEIFDTAVNMGAGDAVKCAQRAINFLRKPKEEPIDDDGILGPITRGKIRDLINGGYRINLLRAMNGEQYIHYKAQGNQHMSRGWTERLALASELTQ